jgi:hypothetical protein
MNAGATAPEWAAAGGGGSSTLFQHISMRLFAVSEVTDFGGSGGALAAINGGIRGYQTAPASGNYAAWSSQIGATAQGNSIGISGSHGQVLLGPVGSAGSGIVDFHFIRVGNYSGTRANDHIGYQFDKVIGTTTPSTTTSDGTTQQKTSISGLTLSFTNNLMVRYGYKYDGTTVSFYVNGVLKNTHSTNVPRLTSTQNYNYINCYNASITSADAFSFVVAGFDLALPITP